MRKKVAIIFIGTNNYSNFFPSWKEAIDNHFLNDCDKKIIAFTDKVDDACFQNIPIDLYRMDHMPWPYVTLYRFKVMTEISNLENFDYVFFMDADLFANQNIVLSDIVDASKALVGVQHPGNFENNQWGTFERSPSSRASLTTIEAPPGTIYHQGCFWGGTGPAVDRMVDELTKRIDDDLSDNVVAIWHDESHMNRYFVENIDDVNTLHAGYACPDAVNWRDKILAANLPIKMVHQHKNHSEYPRFRGLNPNDRG